MLKVTVVLTVVVAYTVVISSVQIRLDAAFKDFFTVGKTRVINSWYYVEMYPLFLIQCFQTKSVINIKLGGKYQQLR